MNTLLSFYQSSVGKKISMALTGFFLCTYLIVHLGGNLFLLANDGGVSFDKYAEILPSIPLILIIEKGLFATFIWHIIMGTMLWWKNKQVRPVKYAMNKPGENSSFTSRTMFLTGSGIFIFLFFHLHFWIVSRFQPDPDFSMYKLVKETFDNTLYSVLYIAAFGLLALHLRHGFQSAFQTFGLKNKKYTPLIEFIAVIFWLLIPLGFTIIPIVMMMRGGN